MNYYNSSNAFTSGGNLKIMSVNQDVTFRGNGSDETRHLQTAMLQTWNKFCFQEGAVDVSARMPGKSAQPGLWPAFWLMGNLGRATFARSTSGFWPFNFNECVPPESPDCDANQCRAQRVSACDAAPGYGFNAHQGRGAPEIDVIEVQPGGFTLEYGSNGAACAQPADNASIVQLRMPQPFVSTSLQAAPGFPHGSQQRPSTGCRPFNYTASDGTLTPQWLPELDIFRYGSASDHTPFTVAANYEFWGDLYEDYYSGVALQTDACARALPRMNVIGLPLTDSLPQMATIERPPLRLPSAFHLSPSLSASLLALSASPSPLLSSHLLLAISPPLPRALPSSLRLGQHSAH